MKILVFVWRKYTALDTLVPILWTFRRLRPQWDIRLYRCFDQEATFLRDRFLAPLLAEMGVPVLPLTRRPPAGDSLLQPSPAYSGITARLLARTRPHLILVDDRVRAHTHPAFAAIAQFVRDTGTPLVIRHHGLWQWPPAVKVFPHLPGLNYQYWCSSPDFLLPRKQLGSRRVQCPGSPGWDSAWLDFLTRRHRQPRRRPACLYLARKILPAGVSSASDFGDISFAEFRRFTRRLLIDSGLAQDMDIIVKPYPTMDRELLEQALGAAGLRDYRIHYSSIYSLIGRIDLQVGELTGAFPVPFLARVPSLMLGFSIHELTRQMHPRQTRRLLPAWYYLLERPGEIEAVLREMFTPQGALSPACREGMERGIAFFRRMFPDQAGERCCRLVEALVQKRSK